VLRSPVVKGRDCFRQTLSHMEYIMSRQSVWVCFVILLGNRDRIYLLLSQKSRYLFHLLALNYPEEFPLKPQAFPLFVNSVKMMTNI